MNHRLAIPFAAFLTVVSLPLSTACAEPMPRHGQGTVEILVGGAPRPRYAHDGRLYVEALKGREYAIRLHNPYPVRVAVALSVDGLNTIDARETTAVAARKWVLEPYGTVVISGWQTSQAEARRFEFTTEARSYGQALGKTTNLGVIAAVFFKERMPVAIDDFAPPQTDSSRRDKSASRPSASAAPPAAPSESREASKQSLAEGTGSTAGASGAGANAAADAAARRADNEFAATGMGRTTDHAVTQVYLDLESAAALSVDIRYEFRPQLVRLGILAPERQPDPLTRRERAEGFCPVR